MDRTSRNRGRDWSRGGDHSGRWAVHDPGGHPLCTLPSLCWVVGKNPATRALYLLPQPSWPSPPTQSAMTAPTAGVLPSEAGTLMRLWGLATCEPGIQSITGQTDLTRVPPQGAQSAASSGRCSALLLSAWFSRRKTLWILYKVIGGNS